MIKADLHIHTTASDGLFTPEEVVDWAIKKEVDIIAITDHDTTKGIDRALNANNKKHLKIIPGIELSSELNNSEIHVLGYCIDYKSNLLYNLSEKIKSQRILRAKKIIGKLEGLNIHISEKDIRKNVGEDFIGRPHIAMALIDNGYVQSIEEAFDKYLKYNGPAYEPRFKLTVNESVNLIHRLGGFAVLAHPGIIQGDINVKELLIEENFDGIEVIHSKHSNEDVLKFKTMAKELELIMTGGSDCHGRLFDGIPIVGDYYINVSKEHKFLKQL